MPKEILVQTQKGQRQVAIIENGRIDEYFVEGQHYQSLLGNIYKGRVESILPSINGAFINIGQPRNGFLYLTDTVDPEDIEQASAPQGFLQRLFNKKKPHQNHHHHHHHKRGPRHQQKEPEIKLTVGQEILVQVVKDPFGEKGARLTTHVTLPGRFVVYMPYDKQGGVSKKIENAEERQRLREVIQNFGFAKTGGFIIRTASHNQGKAELVRDAKFLWHIWQRIVRKSQNEKAPALIYEEGELTWKIVRDYLTEKVDKVLIDSKEDHEKLRKFVLTLIGREMVPVVQLYEGQTPLFEFKAVSRELEKIFDPRVDLKTGAHVVIEQTEGLTVVDVNSGRFKTKASPEDAAFMVNMEAAPEIARQLRLRDLGGIIVIDFIDMNREDHKRKVLEALQNALARDHAKTEVNKISSLGLVEMTRARTGKTIESISFIDCPYCDGRGRVKIA